MSKHEILERVKYYNDKGSWKFSELVECDNFRKGLKFSTIGDLNFAIMDFFYHSMLSQIIRDARERAERLGFADAYDWGKMYLDHYVGWGCLMSKSEYPALHTEEAYDLVVDELIAECYKGDAKYERRKRRTKRSSGKKVS